MHLFNQTNENAEILRTKLNQQGFAVLKSRITLEACGYIKGFIARYPEGDAEINYSGTEKRIWDSQSNDSVIQAFAALSDKVMSAVFQSELNAKTVLAYSNHPIPAEEQLIIGRWHLDSLRKQYKMFCFLSRTEQHTGPLEIVPGTHRTVFKLGAFASGHYLSYTNLGKGKRRYQKLDDHWVDRQCRKLGGSVPFLCEPGTLILVDTSAIHRARPCLEGHRYALCAYYDYFKAKN